MKKALLLLALAFITFSVSVGKEEISFKHLGLKEGLSDCQVFYITKDSKGFMWFSTQAGLNRYDGYTFKSFVHDARDPDSLGDNSVKDVHEDADGLLWVHQEHLGYVCFDPRSETFRSVESILIPRYGFSCDPEIVFIDSEKNIWAQCEKALFRFSPKSEKVTDCLPQEASDVLSIAESRGGEILLLHANGRVERLDRTSGSTASVIEAPSGRVMNENCRLYVDSEDGYWIYSKFGGGVSRYSSVKGQWENFDSSPASPLILSSDRISDISQDNAGRVWLATDQGGVTIIDLRTRSVSYLKNDPFDQFSLIQNSVNCLYRDDEGGMWVGCYKRGVSYYNESALKFRTDYLSDLNYVKDFSPDVNVIRVDSHGNLWAGTSNGLVAEDAASGKRHIYRSPVGSNVIVSMLTASDGKLWMGTYRGGLVSYDGHDFTTYKSAPDFLSDDNVWSLAQDPEGYIWIGTLNHGLQRFDPRRRAFENFAPEGEIFGQECVNAIRIGSDRKLYMATPYGLSVFDTSTRQYEKILGNKAGTQSFSHENVNDVFEDSRGLLWVATAEGLDVFNRERDEIVSLGSKMALSVIEDDNKNMWVTSINGLANIVVGNDPASGRYTFSILRYSELDGFLDQQFNARSLFKTPQGKIFAGGVKGITSFTPSKMKFNRDTPSVVFTDFQLFNTDVKIDSLYSGKRILSQSVSYIPEIRLRYGQNIFSVGFSSTNYILPEKTKYLYWMEGLSEDWLTTADHKLTFTNLNPGRYTLNVKAINSDGAVGEEVSSLGIVIQPPLWRSALAYIFYLFLVIVLLYLGRRHILREERQRYKLAQIEDEAKKKHEIDDMKLRFFTNISHELRTPLTLIISPLENLIRQSESSPQKAKLQMAHRNAVRLLNLVNQLLDFRKIDVNGLQLNPTQGDIIGYIHGVSDSFFELSEKKNIRLFFFSAVKELWMMFDEDKMGKIVMNLLSNAFKFTPEGGRVDVSLDLLSATDQEGVEQFEIKVSDTGIGVPDEYKELIFERFYQVPKQSGFKAEGSGIGLHLVKEFVSLHEGAISVHDNLGKGSVFIVTIPVHRVSLPQIAAPETPVEELPEPSVRTSSKPVLLVVDDNADFRTLMKESLSTDYEVKTAQDGVKAWEMIPQLLPDLIVCDVMMPLMDGNELCRKVKTDIRTSHIPLILLTARSAREQKMEGLESGADDYITKPFDFEILTLRIRKLLQLQLQRKERFSRHIEVNPSEITITSLDEKLIKKALSYVEENISRTDLSVEELSGELGMSRVQLYKKLLSITGKTPIEFIRVIRLKRAAQYLRESQLTVSEIAYHTGFGHPKYFRKYFKDEFGVLPSDYQDREGK